MEASGMNFSLDEYIRKRQMSDPFALLSQRKHKPIISEESLTKSLDDYILSKSQPAQQGKVAGKSSRGKFDRLQDHSDPEDEDNLFEGKCLNDSDVVMKEEPFDVLTIKDDIKEKYDDISDLPRFSTVESENNIRVRSQSFRLLPENMVDLPEGGRRLMFFPLSDTTHIVRSGRVEKNKRRRRHRNNSFASGASIDENLTRGSFVEKGSFTYKFGTRNAGNEDGIIGIERAKQIPFQPAQEAKQEAPAASVINVNLFMNDTAENIKTVMNEVPKLASNVHSSAAHNVLKALQAKRQKMKYNMSIQKEISSLQERPMVFEDKGSSEQKVITTVGEGIDNLKIQPHTTSMPFALRFSDL